MADTDPTLFTARATDGLCLACGERPPSPPTQRCAPCMIRQYRVSELRRARRRQEPQKVAHFERLLGHQSRTTEWEKHHD